MNKTVSSVIEDINEWENPRGGSVFYVTAFFTDETVLSVGRKDHDAALEVQGLLREAIGTEQDFTLEPAGQTKSGKDKFKLLGFGTPGGAATYTAPGVQGDGVRKSAVSPRSPEHDQDRDASIRAAVALKAAASFLSMTAVSSEKVLEVAEFFEEWLQRKASDSVTTSEPASSAYKNDLSVVTPPAGAGSEEPSGSETNAGRQAPTGGRRPQDPDDVPQETRPLPADSPDSHTTEPERAEEGAFGEGVPSTPHVHDYQLRQGVKGFLVCECGKTTKKVTA